MTELMKNELQAWDAGTAEAAAEGKKPPPQRFQPTNGVSTATFNTIRDNPGQPRIFTLTLLKAKGFRSATISSLITQMLRQGMVVERNGGMFATQKEYSPIKSYSMMRNNGIMKKLPNEKRRQEEAKAKREAIRAAQQAEQIKRAAQAALTIAKETPSKGIAALRPEPTPVPSPAPVAAPAPTPVTTADMPEHIRSYVESVLHSMSILQAKYVYAALHELFGRADK